MAQAAVDLKKAMTSSSKGTKRGRTSQPDSKKKAKTDVKPTPPAMVEEYEFGSYNDLQVTHTSMCVTLHKKGTFRLYRRHLEELQGHVQAICTAIQDQDTFDATLSKDVQLAILRYKENGLYVQMSRELKNGKCWTLNLKLVEFNYVMESLEELLMKLHGEKRNTSDVAELKPMNSVELFDEAIKIYSNLTLEEIPKLKRAKCQGCLIQHGSQRQHQCLEEDSVDTMQMLYLEDAVNNVVYENFESEMQAVTKGRKLAISLKMVWKTCRTPNMLQRVRDIVMAPLLLTAEINNLMENDAAAN